MDVNFINTSSPYLENGVNEGHAEASLERLLYHKIISLTIIFLSTFTTAVHVALLLILNRCRKMPTALKWLSVSFVADSMLYYIALLVMCVLFLTVDTAYYYVVRDSFVVLAGGIYCVGCGMSAGLALERYIKLTYPYKFDRILSNMNIILYILISWVISFGVPLVITLEHYFMICKSAIWVCDFSGAMYKITLFYNSVLLFLTLVILWTVYKIRKQVNIQILKMLKTTQVQPLKIEASSTLTSQPHTSLTKQRSCDVSRESLGVTKTDHVVYTIADDARLREGGQTHTAASDSSHAQQQNNPNVMTNNKLQQHRRSQDTQQRTRSRTNQESEQRKSSRVLKNSNFRETQNTVKIIITYVFFQVLFTVPGAIILSNLDWNSSTLRPIIQFLRVACTLIGTYTALYLYIWKFQECKMLFLITFCSWNSRLYDQGKQLKFEVYDIVTVADVKPKPTESHIVGGWSKPRNSSLFKL